MKKKTYSPRSRREKDKIRRSGEQGPSNTSPIAESDEIGEIIEDALIDLVVGEDIPSTSSG
jgi:hypothetical protein